MKNSWTVIERKTWLYCNQSFVLYEYRNHLQQSYLKQFNAGTVNLVLELSITILPEMYSLIIDW